MSSAGSFGLPRYIKYLPTDRLYPKQDHPLLDIVKEIFVHDGFVPTSVQGTPSKPIHVCSFMLTALS